MFYWVSAPQININQSVYHTQKLYWQISNTLSDNVMLWVKMNASQASLVRLAIYASVSMRLYDYENKEQVLAEDLMLLYFEHHVNSLVVMKTFNW